MRPEEPPRGSRPESPSRPQNALEDRREEASGRASSPAPRGRRLRAWIIGLVVAALGAALTDVATGGSPPASRVLGKRWWASPSRPL